MYYSVDIMCCISSGAALYWGIDLLLKVDALRDAVYNHADKITSEVIRQADDLTAKVFQQDFPGLLLFSCVTGLNIAINLDLRKDRKEIDDRLKGKTGL